LERKFWHAPAPPGSTSDNVSRIAAALFSQR